MSIGGRSNKEIFADFHLKLCNLVAVPAGCVCEYGDAVVRRNPLPRPTSSQVQDRLVSSWFDHSSAKLLNFFRDSFFLDPHLVIIVSLPQAKKVGAARCKYVCDVHTSKARKRLKVLVVLLHLWRNKCKGDWRIY